MAFVSTTMMSLLCIICISSLPKFSSEIPPDTNSFQTYIVHVEVPVELTSKSEDLESWYRSFLPPATKASSGEEEASLIYSYRHVMKGFAARLTPDQVKDMEKNERFISARPEEILSIATTHSPNFLGLNPEAGFWKESNFGEGVIIGVLDTGIFPYHSSFGSSGISSPPDKWKGRCDFSLNACSNKLIGARYFRSKQPGIPYDCNGHGTHVAGIAAGNFVDRANIFKQASGTAAGIAPRAHLAIYKVCHTDIGCPEGDVLAGMEAAIDDGVDVLSLSIGGDTIAETIAEGAYNAVKKGIFVSCAAGNAGPEPKTLFNDAPWILTVGASTTDRILRVTAVLGNDQVVGEAVYQPFDSLGPLPLAHIGLCISTTLERIYDGGWIVACEKSTESISTVIEKALAVGAQAAIIINEQSVGATNQLDAYNSVTFPAIQVSYADGERIKIYIQSMWPQATTTLLFDGTVSEAGHAPTVASFSSRGPPNEKVIEKWPVVLKPDILGPGVNILAASHQDINSFVFMSGTSMACPHLSGVAALLKSKHPDWSPSAIKSAIMTTADFLNRVGNPIEDQTLKQADAFATGAGHVNPSKASDPGLVYDIDDYSPYHLCGSMLYTDGDIKMITQEKVNCSKAMSSTPEIWQKLNYPSFLVVFGPYVQTYTRVVTNVGKAKSSYTVWICNPDDGLVVTVTPEKLDFTEPNQKLEYKVTFTLATLPRIGYQGFLMWISDEGYKVRSPFVAILKKPLESQF